MNGGVRHGAAVHHAPEIKDLIGKKTKPREGIKPAKTVILE